MDTEDTIVAIATPSGRGGIGVVRLSGPQAFRIAGEVLRRPSSDEQLTPWHIRMAELCDDQGAVLDRVLVSSFRKPRSYTGEDVVEISCHGSPVLLSFVLESCFRAGARLAQPGEFTMRAFLNGRMDLSQAEAVRDLIEAQTLYQAKVAAQQMDGAVAHWLLQPKQALVDLIAALEAGIDFAEDDVNFLSDSEVADRLQSIECSLEKMAASFAAGKLIHSGLTLAILGRPNVGKSSLFNALLEQDRAIVTATPGTTRDLVSETTEIEGIPLRFVDTAGVRAASDEAEVIGVRRSLEAAADSDLTLLVLDGSAGIQPQDRELLQKLLPLGKLILVVNKDDLPLRISQPEIGKELGSVPEAGDQPQPPVQFVSALHHSGIPELRHAIVQAAAPALAGGREAQFLTNIRHAELVTQSIEAIRRALRAIAEPVPHEMLLLDLYAALRHLNNITGETTVEDILTTIFSTFCIGK